jgi:hypothetical protein
MNLPDKIAKMISPENAETKTYVIRKKKIGLKHVIRKKKIGLKHVIRKKKIALKYFISTDAEFFSTLNFS